MEQAMAHSVQSATLADVLERILDKGIIIAGDIKIKLVDVELLTIQIRLMIASVDKAREMGMDWWSMNGDFSPRARQDEKDKEIEELRRKVSVLESKPKADAGAPTPPARELEQPEQPFGKVGKRKRGPQARR